MNIVVQIDSREKTHAIEHITKYFDLYNIKYYTNKLLVGDYQNLHNPTIIVDRKKNLVELQGNITQEHIRFRTELQKAQENGIQLYVLVEEENVATLEDLLTKYVNPRMKVWYLARARAIKKGVPFKQQAPLNGEKIYKILKTMEEKYGVKFLFSNKRNYAKRLIELLTMESNNE